jgi:hypothetical protein
VWSNGVVWHIAKRDGNSVEGIRIVSKSPEGSETTLTSNTGILSPGSVENPTDINAVRITLRNAKGQSADTQFTADEMMLVLWR